MRVVLQRVTRAQVAETHAPTRLITSIGKGLVILAGFENEDSPVGIEQMAQKIRNLRVFSDAEGKMNLAGQDVQAQYLLTSQFTLYSECRYGNRPSFTGAAEKMRAKEYFEHFVSTFSRIASPDSVRHTAFGSNLQIELVNDGPVTLTLDSKLIL